MDRLTPASTAPMAAASSYAARMIAITLIPTDPTHPPGAGAEIITCSTDRNLPFIEPAASPGTQSRTVGPRSPGRPPRGGHRVLRCNGRMAELQTVSARSRMTSVARRTAPWGFPILYIGWAYVFWSPLVGATTSVWTGANLVLFLVGGASPLLAGVTLAWLTGGGERVRDLGRRLVDVRRVGRRWWLVILLFWPVVDLAAAGAALVLGVTPRPLAVSWNVLTAPGTLLMGLALWLLFPAVEEIGLRGYWLDRLQERFPTTVAALINGTAWAVWHAPFVIFPGYYDATTYQPQLWWWLPSIVCHTVILVWIYNETGRSILAVIVMHAMMNFTGEFLGLAPELHPFMLPGMVLGAVVIMHHWRRQAPLPAASGRPW